MPDIFDYADYRLYLKDLCKGFGKYGKAISNREFARSVGQSSSGFLTDVLNGNRRLSEDQVLRAAEFYGLKGKAIDYFFDLVQYNHATTKLVRDYRLGIMQRYKGGRFARSTGRKGAK